MTDQGKPSVCPECNDTGIVECSADYPGESNVMKCPNERHSSPVPAATTYEPKAVTTQLTNDQIKYMVNRFLEWKLPENFNPDGGISFKVIRNENTAYPEKNEPVGTNLLDATQAKEMILYMVDGMPQAESVPAGKDAAREWLRQTWQLLGRFEFTDCETVFTTIGRVAELASLYAASETAALRAERDKLAETVRKLCDSMMPNPKEHPTMYTAKLEAQKVHKKDESM